MSEITSSQSGPQSQTSVAEEVIFEQMLAEINQLNALMQQDQADIDRLKAESKIITDHTDALLSSLRAHLNTLRRPT